MSVKNVIATPNKTHQVIILVLNCSLFVSFDTLDTNVFRLPTGGDFETFHCKLSINFDRSTKLYITTEPPLLGRFCYLLAFLFNISGKHYQYEKRSELQLLS